MLLFGIIVLCVMVKTYGTAEITFIPASSSAARASPLSPESVTMQSTSESGA